MGSRSSVLALGYRPLAAPQDAHDSAAVAAEKRRNRRCAVHRHWMSAGAPALRFGGRRECAWKGTLPRP